MKPFRVVVAGRPNVGKSALFNRLIRKRRSLVHDLPGMTRDVLEVEARLPDGRAYRLFDTGGFDPEGKEKIPAAVREKAVESIRKADLVLLLVDASAGVLPGDRAAARMARQAGVETVVVANKIDRREGSEGEVEAWELGFAEVYGVSAEHGIGVEELVEAIAAKMPEGRETENGKRETEGETEEEHAEPREIALAVVGRPNVGKSSLVNALVGEERTIVSEVPGTTRDAIDVLIVKGDSRFRLVDTAGIRRKAKTERGPEVLSVVQARKRIEACDVALVVVDATGGPTAQDAAVASYAHESGKGIVVLVNKWDVAGAGAPEEARELEEAIREQMPFAGYAEVLRVSAMTGRGIRRVLPAAARAAENRRRRIGTGELNRVLGRALRDSPPRTARGTRLTVYYVAQTDVAPPTFTLVCNREEALHFSEARRIENLLRKSADFTGSPIRISVRTRSREHAGSKRPRTRIHGRKSRAQTSK